MKQFALFLGSALSVLLNAADPAIPPGLTPVGPLGVEAAADSDESNLFSLSNGMRVEGIWNSKTKTAIVNGSDVTTLVLARDVLGGFIPPKTGVSPAYLTKLDLAQKNHSRAQQKVTDQAVYFEKNFMQLGLLWDLLTPLDAALPVTSAKGVAGGNAIESNRSVQARESFAVLQKNRKDRLKWSKEIQSWADKIRQTQK